MSPIVPRMRRIDLVEEAARLLTARVAIVEARESVATELEAAVAALEVRCDAVESALAAQSSSVSALQASSTAQGQALAALQSTVSSQGSAIAGKASTAALDTHTSDKTRHVRSWAGTTDATGKVTIDISSAGYSAAPRAVATAVRAATGPAQFCAAFVVSKTATQVVVQVWESKSTPVVITALSVSPALTVEGGEASPAGISVEVLTVAA